MAAPADAKTFRVLTSAVEACTIADDVAGAERWMAALEVRILPQCSLVCVEIIFTPTCSHLKPVLHQQEASLTPPASAYTLIIETCARTGNPAAAETWRSRMATHGYSMDESEYSALLKKYEGVERRIPEPVSPTRTAYQPVFPEYDVATHTSPKRYCEHRPGSIVRGSYSGTTIQDASSLAPRISILFVE